MAPRVLCLAAHPDDLEVYMGGTLLVLAGGGARLRAVVVTDGERGTLQPAHGTRRDEQERSFGALGIEGRYLGLPDGGLAGVADLPQRLLAERDAFSPDLVFAPDATDAHPDHAALGRAAQGLATWRWLDARPRCEPTHLVAIGPDFAPLEALIRRHASQIPGPGQSRAHLPGGLDIVERARERARRFGPLAGIAFAEPLRAERAPPGWMVVDGMAGLLAAAG
jgi:LmbE family N-acetylglucosaminyl deacetylase